MAKIVVRHKIVSLKAEGYVSQQSSTEWKHPRGLLAWLWSGWVNYLVVQHFSRFVTISFLCFTTNGVLILVFLFLILCGVSVHVLVRVRVQAKNSNRTTVRMFSKFNLLCGRCTLLSFPSILMSLCTPGNINVLGQSFVSCLSIPCLHWETTGQNWNSNMLRSITECVYIALSKYE